MSKAVAARAAGAELRDKVQSDDNLAERNLLSSAEKGHALLHKEQGNEAIR
jgi:hypothetical protein